MYTSCHWLVQDLVNAIIFAGLNIKEIAELKSVNASFWYTYDELIKQSSDELLHVNNWERNPMAALPAWLTIVSQK